MKPEYFWDFDEGEALCVLSDGNNTFVGAASCNPEDEDMKSEKTGLYIACVRAQIKALQYRKREIKTELKILKHLYATMKDSKKFNPKSYENKMLQRQIQMHEDDLKNAKTMLESSQDGLRTFLKNKGEFYEKIRKNRQLKKTTGPKELK